MKITTVEEVIHRTFRAEGEGDDHPIINAGGSVHSVLIELRNNEKYSNILLDWDTWNALVAHVAEDRDYFAPGWDTK